MKLVMPCNIGGVSIEKCNIKFKKYKYEFYVKCSTRDSWPWF